MFTCSINDKGIGNNPTTRAYGFIVSEENVLANAQDALAWYPHLSEVMAARGFTGKSGQVFVVPTMVNTQERELLFVGIGSGKQGNLPVERYRRAVGTLIRHAAALKVSSLTIVIPHAALFGISEADLLTQTIVTARMAAFHFTLFLSEKETDRDLKELVLAGEALGAVHDNDAIIRNAIIVADAVNKAREWIDMPPSQLTPPIMADAAHAIAEKYRMPITIFGEQQIIDMGMGGLAAVSRGSDIECRLVIMEYKTEAKNAPTVAFVGKGITFDSGGLSLKPARSMETMKDDMSGAAAVIATMEALAQLKPLINVIGVAPLSENLPSGKATKPGDIIRFYNGKTAEVKNTDAEGRLILADALSYTVKKYAPDAIIDLATLTGACAHALGPFYCGMMSEHDELVTRMKLSSERSGDRVWRLPLHDDYKAAIKSNLADICNIGNEKIMAGAITAAHFLQHFVGDTPWAHLDIAGTAFDVPNVPYLRAGATGFGVRLLIDLAMHWDKQKDLK
jgi:leucyl aminopeptidase